MTAKFNESRHIFVTPNTEDIDVDLFDHYDDVEKFIREVLSDKNDTSDEEWEEFKNIVDDARASKVSIQESIEEENKEESLSTLTLLMDDLKYNRISPDDFIWQMKELWRKYNESNNKYQNN